MFINSRFGAVLPLKGFGGHTRLISNELHARLNAPESGPAQLAYLKKYAEHPPDVAVLLGTLDDYRAPLRSKSRFPNQREILQAFVPARQAIKHSPVLNGTLLDGVVPQLRQIIADALNGRFAPAKTPLGTPVAANWFRHPVTLTTDRDAQIMLLPDKASNNRYILNGLHAGIGARIESSLDTICQKAAIAGIASSELESGLNKVFSNLVGSPVQVIEMEPPTARAFPYQPLIS